MSLEQAIRLASSGAQVPGPLLEEAFGRIMDGKASPVQIAALLIALRTKGETIDEIVAAARAMRSRAVAVPLRDPRTIDTCGTGGDGIGTFNVSTAVAFVVAGAGVPVAKHGNRAASGRAGSFDVLEALGVRIDLPIEASARLLEEIGIAPFFARTAHPAMRYVAPVREELGVRTIMNCLGPLLNPAGVRRQLVGVYASKLVVPLAEALLRLGAERALVVHGVDGLDEVSISSATEAALVAEGEVRPFKIDALVMGIRRARHEELAGGDAAENAAILREILAGARGPRRELVALNAAAALWVADAVPDLPAGLEQACHSIDSGAARAKLAALVERSNAVAA